MNVLDTKKGCCRWECRRCQTKAVHRAYSKRAEVTVPSLDDWERQWKQNPQGIVKPAVVQGDFRGHQEGEVADNAGVPAVTADHGT